MASGTLNERHVNFVQAAGRNAFGPVIPNPVPKPDRIK